MTGSAEKAGGRVTALVPMKGHSERISNKNLRPFRGRPLCLWILDTLARTEEVGRIVVNTDSEEIAETVRGIRGVLVHERPQEIRGDYVSMNRVIENDLGRREEGDEFLQTHCTNPLVTSETFSRAINDFWKGVEAGKADSLFSVTRHQARFYDAEGQAINHDPARLVRTQDLEPIYEENSCIYLFSRASFARSKQRIGESPLTFEVEKLQALDIDEPADFLLAEQLHRVQDQHPAS